MVLIILCTLYGLAASVCVAVRCHKKELSAVWLLPVSLFWALVVLLLLLFLP